MNRFIFSSTPWQQPRSSWLRLAGFLITVAVATVEQWSAPDLAWSFWLSGLVLGLIYLTVYQIAQGDKESWLLYPFLLIFYVIFASFLDITFAWTIWETTGQSMSPLFGSVPMAIARTVDQQWPFLLTSGLAQLPDYILDARTVHFTDLSRPLFVKDLLRMVALIFLLVPLILMQTGIFALYAVLLVYFLPWESVRQIGRRVWNIRRRGVRSGE